MEKMENKTVDKALKIPSKAKVRVYWDDIPYNYSKESRNKIIAHYSELYNLDKKNIKVVFRPIKINKGGDRVSISGAGIDNIMDKEYQRKLMIEWLKREERTIDTDRLFKLDDKVNASLDIDINDISHGKWSIKKLWIDNLLCFGEGNMVNFDNIKGFNVITSTPANTGGKTTFIVDTISFLFFGKTAKAKTNDDLFNTFTDKNEVLVKSLITIENIDYIIERHLTRSLKRAGGWNIKNVVNYYMVLPDGSSKQLIEATNQEEQDGVQTTKKIIQSIGSEDDFNTIIIATGANLEDLIDATSTSKGKLLTRFIGLEVVEKKEEIARKQYNEFAKKMKSNIYSVIDLTNEIKAHNTNIESGELLLATYVQDLKKSQGIVDDLNLKKEVLIGRKQKIDANILTLDPTKLDSEIKIITENGLLYKNKIKEYKDRLTVIGKVKFDEDNHNAATKEKDKANASITLNTMSIEQTNELILQLKNGEICPTCKRVLADVDHSKDIKENEDKVLRLTKENLELSAKVIELNKELETLEAVKKVIDEKNTLELNVDKAEVEMASLRNKLTSKNNDLKSYNLNQEAIKINAELDIEVQLTNTKIQVANNDRDIINRTIQKVKDDIEVNKKDIKTKEEIIEQINKEDEIEKIYKIYIDLVGKKGISKLVLRSVLPIINSELYRLLEDVTDFDIELSITDKNDVIINLIKDDVIKDLSTGSGYERTASALALRCVLGRVSNLPKPNFVAFDEVLGKVSLEYLDNIKLLFDKIKDMFDMVFLITHNDIVQSWGDNIITINKINNVSEILVP